MAVQSTTFQLAKSQRLLKRSEFLQAQRLGERFKRGPLLVLVAKALESVPRIGLTVSRKVGKAHTRNRVKRRLRAILRQKECSLFLEQRHYVFIARQSAADSSFQKLNESLTWLLNAVKKQST